MDNSFPPAESLAHERCRPLRGEAQHLDPAAAAPLLALLPDWQIADRRLVREFRFPDFRATMLLASAIACLAERENHHPELEIAYGRLRVAWSTHDVGGLSRNDFICAAKVDALAAL